MKLLRRIKNPRLAEFADRNLPHSLVLQTQTDGYSCTYHYIYQKGHTPWLGLGRGDPVAQIKLDTVELMHPNYFSDIEDLVRKYEAETGHEITVEYWQDPKEKALA
jgi:hypothetical protein